jgi:hypothetical protein
LHWSGVDEIPSHVPPKVFYDAPGWAYGAFLIDRFKSWNASDSELALIYLMSTSNPYQVQVMRTTLRMPSLQKDMLRTLSAVGVDFSVSESDIGKWLVDVTTPYPKMADALLRLLGTRRLRRPVYLDVIVYNYGHTSASVDDDSEVDTHRLSAALLESYRSRYGESHSNVDEITR